MAGSQGVAEPRFPLLSLYLGSWPGPTTGGQGSKGGGTDGALGRGDKAGTGGHGQERLSI